MCLSPLLFDEFYVDAIVQGEEPIMSEQAYKFIYTFQALAVFPGAVASTFTVFPSFLIGTFPEPWRWLRLLPVRSPQGLHSLGEMSA